VRALFGGMVATCGVVVLSGCEPVSSQARKVCDILSRRHLGFLGHVGPHLTDQDSLTYYRRRCRLIGPSIAARAEVISRGLGRSSPARLIGREEPKNPLS